MSQRMSLPERLHVLLAEVRPAVQSSLPDPTELDNAGEVTVRGATVTVRSSVPMDDLANQSNFTVYLHTKGGEDTLGAAEQVRYFHYDSRQELSAVDISLRDQPDGLRQNVRIYSVPREMVMGAVNRYLGRAEPRERGERGGRGGGGDYANRGGGDRRGDRRGGGGDRRGGGDFRRPQRDDSELPSEM